jgi:hypothetical protein
LALAARASARTARAAFTPWSSRAPGTAFTPRTSGTTGAAFAPRSSAWRFRLFRFVCHSFHPFPTHSAAGRVPFPSSFFQRGHDISCPYKQLLGTCFSGRAIRPLPPVFRKC